MPRPAGPGVRDLGIDPGLTVIQTKCSYGNERLGPGQRTTADQFEFDQRSVKQCGQGSSARSKIKPHESRTLHCLQKTMFRHSLSFA
jgi:hypothetical protein